MGQFGLGEAAAAFVGGVAESYVKRTDEEGQEMRLRARENLRHSNNLSRDAAAAGHQEKANKLKYEREAEDRERAFGQEEEMRKENARRHEQLMTAIGVGKEGDLSKQDLAEAESIVARHAETFFDEYGNKITKINTAEARAALGRSPKKSIRGHANTLFGPAPKAPRKPTDGAPPPAAAAPQERRPGEGIVGRFLRSIPGAAEGFFNEAPSILEEMNYINARTDRGVSEDFIDRLGYGRQILHEYAKASPETRRKMYAEVKAKAGKKPAATGRGPQGNSRDNPVNGAKMTIDELKAIPTGQWVLLPNGAVRQRQ